jgi:hypothetical protein
MAAKATRVLIRHEDEPEPHLGDEYRCDLCGEAHVRVIRWKVVTHADVAAAKAMCDKPDRG